MIKESVLPCCGLVADLRLYYRMIMEIDEILKALADPNRLRILNLLQGRTLCVCDLERVLELNQSNLSRHLAKLRQVKLIAARKQGLFSYYSRLPIDGPFAGSLETLLETISQDPRWEADRVRLLDQECC